MNQNKNENDFFGPARKPTFQAVMFAVVQSQKEIRAALENGTLPQEAIRPVITDENCQDSEAMTALLAGELLVLQAYLPNTKMSISYFLRGVSPEDKDAYSAASVLLVDVITKTGIKDCTMFDEYDNTIFVRNTNYHLNQLQKIAGNH